MFAQVSAARDMLRFRPCAVIVDELSKWNTVLSHHFHSICPVLCIRFEATWPSASLYMEGNPTKKAWSRETPKKQSFVIVVLNKIAFPPLFLSYRVDTGRQCLKILVGSKEKACFTDAICKNPVRLWWLLNQNEKVEKQLAFVLLVCLLRGLHKTEKTSVLVCVTAEDHSGVFIVILIFSELLLVGREPH